MKHRFEIHRNAEGNKLAYLSPVDDNGETKSGWRISGPKAWGGSKLLAEIDVDDDEIVKYIRRYAKHLIPLITEEAKP